MQFGPLLGEACGSFALTNIDDIFVLVTFFAETTTSPTLTPLKVTLGQFLGFSIIVLISLIGYAVALVLPAEPIGFLGLLPVLLGLWNFCDLFIPKPSDEDAGPRIGTATTIKAIAKVSLITLMNGGDNISLYIPLFAQLQGAEIAVYIVTYYVLLGAYCAFGWLIMKQRHILRVAQKYTSYLIPFLYMGLGVCIIVKSDCFPWSIQMIDDSTPPDPGTGIMAGATTFILLASIGVMVVMKWRQRVAPVTLSAVQETASTHSGVRAASASPGVRAASQDEGDQGGVELRQYTETRN